MATSHSSPCSLSLHPYLLATENDAVASWKRRWRKLSEGSCHESSSHVLASPAKKKKAWTRLYVIIYVTFLAALHGHSCILRCHDNKVWPALGKSQFLCTYGCPQWQGSNTEWPVLSVFTPWVKKTEAPAQPMRFCFLCGLYWCLLSTYILIYLEKTGDIQ